MGLKRWIGSVAMAALVVATGVAGMALPTRPASAAPPMWEVTDADSRLVLFGTVHVLRPETQWVTDRLREVLTSADSVWFEVDPHRADDPGAIQALLPLMMDPKRPLSTRLTGDQQGQLRQVATTVGVNSAQLEPFKPASAAMMLASAAIVRAGYSPESGVDKVLRGKVPTDRVREFETLEQQIRFITDLPDPVQVSLLMTALDDIADLGHLDKVVEGWAAGDLAAMETLFLEELLENHPEAYDVFLRSRNLAWADRLEGHLQGAGLDLVAVGALHLVGPDGLPELLAARGYTVRRVQ